MTSLSADLPPYDGTWSAMLYTSYSSSKHYGPPSNITITDNEDSLDSHFHYWNNLAIYMGYDPRKKIIQILPSVGTSSTALITFNQKLYCDLCADGNPVEWYVGTRKVTTGDETNYLVCETCYSLRGGLSPTNTIILSSRKLKHA